MTDIPPEVLKRVEDDFAPVRERIEAALKLQPESVTFEEAKMQVESYRSKIDGKC